MADLKNLGKFAASVAGEAESIVASARRQLEALIKEKASELADVERAAAEMMGGSFEALFKSAAFVAVRELRVISHGDDSRLPRILGVQMELDGGYFRNADGSDGHGIFYDRKGAALAAGTYRAIVILLPVDAGRVLNAAE